MDGEELLIVLGTIVMLGLIIFSVWWRNTAMDRAIGAQKEATSKGKGGGSLNITQSLEQISRIDVVHAHSAQLSRSSKKALNSFYKDHFVKAEFFMYGAIVYRTSWMLSAPSREFFIEFDKKFVPQVEQVLRKILKIHHDDLLDFINSRFDIYESICMSYIRNTDALMAELDDALTKLLKHYYVKNCAKCSISLRDFERLPTASIDYLEELDMHENILKYLTEVFNITLAE